MYDLKKCGKLGWALCDGDCKKCRTTATTTIQTTERLINADEAIRLITAQKGVVDKSSCKRILYQMPTVEVKHGKWELAEDGWYCSVCKLYPPFDCDPEEKGIPYCPNCGADMRKETEDAIN